MDTAQPKGRLRAFLKHATVRISSGKGHGFADDSTSAYSIDDDGRSQRSSKSGKKDGKLRRLGRGIREWRSKRKRRHGDTMSITSQQTVDGTSFSSSDGGSFTQEALENDGNLTDEDERFHYHVHEPEDSASGASEDLWDEHKDKEVQGTTTHMEVAVRDIPTEPVEQAALALRETQNQAQPRNKVALSHSPAILPPPYVYSSLAWPDMTLHEGGHVDALKCLVRLCDQWRVLCFSDYNCPEKVLTASVAIRIVEQYLGVWVELHWVPTNYGISNLHVVLSAKALGQPSYGRTVGQIEQPAARGPPRQLLHPPSVHLAPEVGRAIANMTSPSARGVLGPNHGSRSSPQYKVVPIPIYRPPLPALPPSQPEVRPKKREKKKSAALKKALCTHCGHYGHVIRECFEKFPEQKMAFPQRYAKYGERERLESVVPGAFHTLARLHPQLMPQQTIHGHDTRYMVGRIGISPHLTPKQYATWAIRYQEAHSVHVQRRQIREKCRWDEAHDVD
jgi:hypothetical protein